MTKIKTFIHGLLFSSPNSTNNTIYKWVWRLTFAGIIAVALFFFALSKTNLPSLVDLENPKTNVASQVFATTGEVLGRFYNPNSNRVLVSYDELSPNIVNALIATEDERYYSHSGIDFKGLARALAFLGSRGGASTISQQLAKSLFTGVRSRNITEAALQKFKEWIIAVRLERKYTKEEIMALYLNRYDFINGAQGIKAASEIYFGKSQKELNIEEAATLIGMLKNSSLYNPLRRPELVKQRREVVLKQMQKNNLLTSTAYDSLRQLPLGLNYSHQTHVDGLAPYFRSETAKEVKKLLEENNIKKEDGTNYNIYTDGLKIYTTIDPKIQAIAEEEMTKHMKKVQKSFFQVWRKMDPWTYRSGSEHEISVELRERSFTKLIRGTMRYQRLRSQHLDKVIAVINQDVDLVFHDDDREVERIVKASKDANYITKLVDKGQISSKLGAKYRKVLKGPHFTRLKANWENLQKDVEKTFNEPVEMKVFAYNDKMETDTIMSPWDSVRYHRMFLQTGMVAIDPKTGFVKAWVGGVNHKYFKYDHVRINRQVGSTFKPFVYATAIAQQGLSPCYQVYDLPISIEPGDGDFFLNKKWSPQNSHGEFTGKLYTLKEGLRTSKNTVSVRLMKELGSAEPVRDLVDRMGIDKTERYANGQLRVPNVPSICLGSTDLSVYEMTGAYTTFANNGIYNEPIFITTIKDKDGNVLYNGFADRTVEQIALKPQANYVMVDMLRYSGNMAYVDGKLIKSDTGGKTGTTNDYVDGWFMGITPDLVVGTWAGGEDKWMAFRSIQYGQGAYMAKPFFRKFIKRLEEEEDVDYDAEARFYRPAGDLGIVIDCELYDADLIPIDDQDPFEDEESEFGDDDMFGDETE